MEPWRYVPRTHLCFRAPPPHQWVLSQTSLQRTHPSSQHNRVFPGARGPAALNRLCVPPVSVRRRACRTPLRRRRPPGGTPRLPGAAWPSPAPGGGLSLRASRPPSVSPLLGCLRGWGSSSARALSCQFPSDSGPRRWLSFTSSGPHTGINKSVKTLK